MKTAMQIAHYIVEKCSKENKAISNLQLQKILYYIQKTALQSDTGKPIFNDDFVAWKFGPVIEEVYYAYCVFGAMPIRRTYNEPIEGSIKTLIDPIISRKRELDPWDMVAETHKEGGAWYITFNSGLGNGKVIDKNLIRQRG